MPRKKSNKVKLTLSVDKKLVETAKESELNISDFLEIQPFQHLNGLENSNIYQNKAMRGVGFEPTNPYGTGP